MVASSAEAAAFKSLNQALALAGRAAQQAVAPSNGVTASKQAALGAENLATAAARFRSLSQILANPSAVASAPSPIVVDGYGPGKGLQTAFAADGKTPLQWVGAATPAVTQSAGATTVTVTQNQALAQLTWQTFNVGAKTTLNFDQIAGGKLASSWVVINKVQDPLANPTQILGAINAQGKVYVINQNGIAFGRGSTINLGSLIAATAVIADNQFQTSTAGITSFNLYGAQAPGTDQVSHTKLSYSPSFISGTAASITVDPGAVIQTAAPTGTNGGGYVMLLGGNVTNGGVISTPLGQTVLAAGTSFTLRPGTTGGINTGNTTSTTLGSEVAATNYGTSATGALTIDPSLGTYATGGVTNAGIVLADQGDISLVGHALSQAGVLLSTTTVNQRGTVHLLTPSDGSDPGATVTLAPGSVTEILPEDNGATALDSQRASDVAISATLNLQRLTPSSQALVLNNTNNLPDQVEESRVEISTGGAVDVGVGALVVAQGGQIVVGGGSQVHLETGAALDVSGTTTAQVASSFEAINLYRGVSHVGTSTSSTFNALSQSVADLLVNVQPFQLRDSAANRTGGLKGTNVYVDAATLVEIASGAYAGNIYTPGGLLEVSGYLGLVPHSIAEWSAIGGQVTLQAQQTRLGTAGTTQVTTSVPGLVQTDAGSVINLQGGVVDYQAGPVQQSYVQAADGTVYNINRAPSNLVYTGLYQGATTTYARWNTTLTYVNPLLTPAVINEPGFSVGRDAGVLTAAGATSALQGAVYAGVTLGQFQTERRPSTVTDPYLLANTVVPQGGTLQIGNYLSGLLQTITTPTSYVIGPVGAPAGTASVLDAGILNDAAFSSILLSTGGGIAVNAPLAVGNGGTVSLIGANIAINAGITARGGAITLTDQLAAIPGPVGTVTSISVAPGAVLDVRGVWSNGLIDPSHLAGAAFANAGRVSLISANGISLAAGSRIDASSGGGILANGQALTGRGGSVSVEADVLTGASTPGTASLVFDATIIGYGSAGGGTLTVSAPTIQIGASINSVLPVTILDPALLSTGFARYAIDGTQALTVLPGTQLTAAQPIYVLNDGLALPSGSDPSSAYSVILPALYTPVKGTDVLSQRAGASISLFSAAGGTSGLFSGTDPQLQGGALSIGAGAIVSVDPDQSITAAGFGQTTLAGTLVAHGGAVTVANLNGVADSADTGLTQYSTANYHPGVSVWLDQASLIDVSGQAAVQTDGLGRLFGLAGSGGTVTLGSLAGVVPTYAQVIMRAGARINADGAAATVDVVPGTQAGTGLLPRSVPVTLMGAGGTVAADSINGVELDGSLTARAGGAGAAAGTLSLTLDASHLTLYGDIPTYVFQPERILVTQANVAVQTDATLQPGQVSAPATFGLIRASQQQVDEGGFGALRLSAQSAAIIFDGDVSLHAANSLVLNSGIIGTDSPAGHISLAAPYVGLFGASSAVLNNTSQQQPDRGGVATLAVRADLIEISQTLFLGGLQQFKTLGAGATQPPPGFGPPATPYQPDVLGFSETSLTSNGDIRFLGNDGGTPAQFTSFGNLTFQAAQITPATGSQTDILAGQNPDSNPTVAQTAQGTIRVIGNGITPQAPYTVGGSLSFEADTILQDGIVRAPEGAITFTDGFLPNGPAYASTITFAPGSITSVSLAGQTIPYGGTADGVTYVGPGGGAPKLFNPIVSVQSQVVTVQDGASIDLRGGGTLSGAGFVFGRGGTADVLTTPLLDISGGQAVANAQAQVAAIQPVRSGDAVYAILPGYASAYAPAAAPGDAGYTATKIGQQITVGSNVPGLSAGTYTLLPAYYALLPGGYRVELTPGTSPAQTNLPQGNFTSLSPVTLSTANTGIVNPVQVAALFTSGTNVRQLSQYDEESYNQFEAASASQFGEPRPFLPQDAKTLQLRYPSVIAPQPALNFAPSALLDSAPGGYGATVEIGFASAITGNTLVVAGQGNPETTVQPNVLVLESATLDALNAPRLVLGGNLTVNIRSANIIDVNSTADAVYILPLAKLTAGEVMIPVTAGGQIVVEPGGTISTLGAGPSSYDGTNGFVFNTASLVAANEAAPVLDVSNGIVTFVPTTLPSRAASIQIGDGSGLLAGGSLDIVAPLGTQVQIGQATLAAQSASIAVAALNIGAPAALAAQAGQLPSGLDISPDALAGLLNGNPALGTPAATQLVLTATQEVNFLGSVTLNTGSTDLVLNTPAIYGVGTASDNVSISAPRITWSGIGVQVTTNSGTQTVSTLPGGQIAAGLSGAPETSLSLNAGTILLGNAPGALTDNQNVLQRDVAGFTTVSLNATTEITANNKSALGVYVSEPVVGKAGTGGTLNLNAPLITTDSAAVLNLQAGSAVNLMAPTALSATGPVTTLGGQINIVSGSVRVDTAVALPAGQFDVTAQDAIGVSGSIDLSGRTIHIADKSVQLGGGTLAFESTAGSIALATGSRIDVSAPGAAAGSLSFNALAGAVALDGSLAGTVPSGQTGGSFSVVAGTLSTSTLAANVAAGGSAFDNINAGLNAGGFTASRAFEFGTDVGPGGKTITNLTIGNDISGASLLHAGHVSVTADLGSIDVTGTVDAAGSGPGSIAFAAAGNLTLEAGATLDAHASTTALDSYGQPIDAENRAHVTLTSTAGTLALNGGTINLSYPGQQTPTALSPLGNLQGQLVLNAPRNAAGNDVQIVASAPAAVKGAQSIALYAWRTYFATGKDGLIAQTSASPDVLALAQIHADSTQFIDAAGANTDLAARLSGLSTYSVNGVSAFHLRPGVEIDSAAGAAGILTVRGDLDLSRFRYSDTGYGTRIDPSTYGSGEAGAIVLRAANNLFVNGSVTDGFDRPADRNPNNYLPADNSWVFFSPSIASSGAAANQLGADVILPASITIVEKSGKVVHQVELTANTTFDTSRAISLNYPIRIGTALLNANVVVPFSATIAAGGDIVVPPGGFVATADITSQNGTVIPAGTALRAGAIIAAGSTFAAGSVFPVQVQIADNTKIPAGTLLTVFADANVTLFVNTAPLPVNALIPSNTVPNFVTVDGAQVSRLDLRPAQLDSNNNPVQGYLYALSALLPPGSQSWNLDFVAGANQASANVNALTPRSVLDGGALAEVANTANQAPGSLILDDEHYLSYPKPLVNKLASPAFSVIRTGTGELTLEAGGNFDQSSLFGIYTSGTQTQLQGGAAVNAPYNLRRENFDGNKGLGGVLAGGPQAAGNKIVAETYQANYPNGGGDVLVAAQGSVTGDVYGGGGSGNTPGSSLSPFLASDLVGNWLWRQGGSGLNQATSWWINFGTLVVGYAADNNQYNVARSDTQLTGFQGIGALGGGNVSIIAGIDAGQTTNRTGPSTSQSGALRGEGLIAAVSSTGRVVTAADGTQSLVQTGGGHLDIRVAGTINPLDQQSFGIAATGQSDLNGVLTNLRGDINVAAGAVGRLDQSFPSLQNKNQPDPRPVDPTVPTLTPIGGITLMPGDSTVLVTTQRDIVIDGVGDAGRVTEQNLTRIAAGKAGSRSARAGDTGFSLWKPDTAVALVSDAGNVAPITIPPNSSLSSAAAETTLSNDGATDNRFVYPSQLHVTAAVGDIVYGDPTTLNQIPLEVAPSGNEQVQFVAGRSIQANGMAVDLSGADPGGLSTPFNPAYLAYDSRLAATSLTNIRTGGATPQSPLALFAFEPDTPATTYLSATALAEPARFYASQDILNFVTGETLTFNSSAFETLPQWYLAAKSVWIVAGRDIVNSGTRPSAQPSSLQQNQQDLVGASGIIGMASGNLFLNNNTVSLVSAGRDILGGYFYAGGPGLLEVDAGRNIQQINAKNSAGADVLTFGSIKSLGSLLTGAPVSLTGGSDILVSAGLTAQPNGAAFGALYLNPANLANLAINLTDPANTGKVSFVYTAADLSPDTLTQIGYTGQTDFLAFFKTLSPNLQNLVVRDIFFKELLAAGRQYNDPTSRFFHDYVRGKRAIDAFNPCIATPATCAFAKMSPGYASALATGAVSYAAPVTVTGPNTISAGGLSFSSAGNTSAPLPDNPIGIPLGYTGTITMASGTLTSAGGALFDAGVATEHGGNIQVIDPGGPVILGTSGSTQPGGGTGLITNGNGNIEVFSLGSDLLGKSRIFTNAGGNIQIWSAVGDINAGIGARTSVVFNPPVLSYDNTGGIVESPAIPTSGSGIATNQPLPSIAVGNIDLTAPLGTIDAGEAGVRSSGNLNLAAARLANQSGFSSGGKTTGGSSAPSFSLAAADAAGAAAGAGQQAAQNLGGSRAEGQQPSVLEVEVLSISGESEEERRKKRK